MCFFNRNAHQNIHPENQELVRVLREQLQTEQVLSWPRSVRLREEGIVLLPLHKKSWWNISKFLPQKHGLLSCLEWPFIILLIVDFQIRQMISLNLI